MSLWLFWLVVFKYAMAEIALTEASANTQFLLLEGEKEE